MAAWPLAARSQEPRGQTRLIGVVVPFSKTDSEVRPLLAAFNQRFRELGWTEGHNVRLEYRFTAGNSEQLRAAAAELVGLAPDVILAHGASTVGPLLQLTRTIPIVFPAVFDPVGAGVVDNLARPGGNITGFMSTEYSMGWEMAGTT
jgi:putative ABC transport system substrate-binding protein